MLLINHTEVLLKDGSFTRSLNQRRDALARYPLGLILLLPSGGDYLLQISRTMPDLWSLRNLVSELIMPLDLGLNGIFISDTGREYISFSSESEAREELNAIQERIHSVTALPENLHLLATLYTRQGKIYSQLSEYKNAEKAFEQALDIARETGNRQLEATVLAELGDVYYYIGDYRGAREYGEKGLLIAREIGDKSGEGRTLNNIGQTYSARGDYKTAFKYLEDSLRISREIGNKSGQGMTFNNIGEIYYDQGDYETALQYLEQSLRLSREIGEKSGEGRILNNISQIYDARGEYETALKYLEQSLRISREIGTIDSLAVTLNNMAAIIFQQQGKPEEALPLFIQSYSIFRQIGSPNEKIPERFISDIKAQIGEARFQEIIAQMQKG
ncbi:MAG: tetratricopeptide repeat protein [Bacteroidia bacterium]